MNIQKFLLSISLQVFQCLPDRRHCCRYCRLQVVTAMSTNKKHDIENPMGPDGLSGLPKDKDDSAYPGHKAAVDDLEKVCL